MAGLAQGLRGSDFEAEGMGLWKMSSFALITQNQTCHSLSQTAQRQARRFIWRAKDKPQSRWIFKLCVKKRLVNPIVHSSSSSSFRNGHCTPLPTLILSFFFSLYKVFNYRAQSIWWTGSPWGGCLLTRCAHNYVFWLSKWASLASKPMPPPLVRLNK